MKRSRLHPIGLVIIAAFTLCAVAACGDAEQQRRIGGELMDMVGPNGMDLGCNSSDASSGLECTQDCTVECGFQKLGTKICTCVSGYYSQCPCFPPDDYQGAPTAPACSTLTDSAGAPLTPDGTTTYVKGRACSEEWQECIGSDPSSSTTPRGCVCMVRVGTGEVGGGCSQGACEWFCGSTNRWFMPE